MARKIAILGGTGPEGSGLANRLARAGEHIVIGSREAHRAPSKRRSSSALALVARRRSRARTTLRPRPSAMSQCSQFPSLASLPC